MGDLLQPWHIVIVVGLAILLFGGKKLPELGKGLGEGLKGFREGIKGGSDPSPATPSVQQYSSCSAHSLDAGTVRSGQSQYGICHLQPLRKSIRKSARI